MSDFCLGEDGDSQPIKREISISSRFRFDGVDRSLFSAEARMTSTS